MEHCSNDSVFPSVSECIFLNSSFGCGLIHRNTKYATMLAQNGINIPASSFIEWQITPTTTALYNSNPFQTFGFLPCHRYGHLNSWLAAILSEVEKKPTSVDGACYCLASIVAFSNASRSFSTGKTGSRQLPRGRVRIGLIIVIPTLAAFPRGWIIPAKSQRGARD